MSDWFVYIARCADESLYTGSTNDLQRREQEHNSSKAGARYTRARRPVQFVYFERCDNRSAAVKRECEIKALSRNAKAALVDSFDLP